MRVLHVASEVAPYSQSGGLAQVAGALPDALARADKEATVAVLSPFYRCVEQRDIDFVDTDVRCHARLAGVDYHARILSDPNSRSFFVDCPPLYDRSGLYTDGKNKEYPDNAVRFAFLCRVAVDVGDRLVGGAPDVVHAHDWQTGLVAAYYQLHPEHERPKTIFTVHNLAFQGVFDKQYVESLGLEWQLFGLDGLEFYDQLSFLKAGAAFSDRITTVSPTYAEEITTEPFGHGLAGFFVTNQDRLFGILNGIDQAAWDPATDTALAARYSATDRRGKRDCRRALATRFELTLRDDQLLCGVVSRLAIQKGPDLVAELVPALSGIGAALVLLGSGEPELEARFAKLAEWFGDHFAAVIGYDEILARQMFAGCDALLMPSRFEPCGLAQLAAMRYGTLPVVHAVGGLADTVTDPGDVYFAQRDGTGFCFHNLDAGGLKWATGRAAKMFREHRPVWEQAVVCAMTSDFSWDASAAKYLELYREDAGTAFAVGHV